MKDNTERARSEGATPVGSPHKWTQEERKEEVDGVRGEVVGGERGRGRRDTLSSDEDLMPEVATRPRQRSLKRKKIGFTNTLSSEQLVGVSGHGD